MTTPEHNDCNVPNCLDAGCQAKGPYPTLMSDIDKLYDFGGPATLAKFIAEGIEAAADLDRLSHMMYLSLYRNGVMTHPQYASQLNTLCLMAIPAEKHGMYAVVKRRAIGMYEEGLMATAKSHALTLLRELDDTRELPEGVTTLDGMVEHYQAYAASIAAQQPMVQPVLMSQLPKEVQDGLREVLNAGAEETPVAPKPHLH